MGELSREDIPSSLVSPTNMGLKYVPFSDTRRFLRSIALSMLRPFEVLRRVLIWQAYFEEPVVLSAGGGE